MDGDDDSAPSPARIGGLDLSSVKLKTAAPKADTPPPAAGGRDDLLAQIRNRDQLQLRKVREGERRSHFECVYQWLTSGGARAMTVLMSPQVAEIKKEPEPEPDEADDIAGALMRALAGRAKKVVIDSGPCRRPRINVARLRRGAYGWALPVCVH